MTVQLCKDCQHCEDRHSDRHDLAYCRAPRYRITCIVSGDMTYKDEWCIRRRSRAEECPDFTPRPPSTLRATLLRASGPTRWAAIVGHQMRSLTRGLGRSVKSAENRLARAMTAGVK